MCALCQAGCICSVAIGTTLALVNLNQFGGKDTMLSAATVIFGVASVCLGVGSVFKLYQRRVYIAPDGVVIRIGRTDEPKYDNKKRRGLLQ